MTNDPYRAGAKHYDDAYSVKVDLADRDFYLDLAEEYGRPVLELGCGTGRITIPVARQGVDITGLDASPSMLGVLRRKLVEEPQQISTPYPVRRVHALALRATAYGRSGMR